MKVGRWGGAESTLTLPARSLMVAAGTSPNVTYEKEAARAFQARFEEEVLPGASCGEGKNGQFQLVEDSKGFFTSYEHDGRFVSYYGDNHPRYAGNVVKAMASAKAGYPKVVALFADRVATLDPAAQSERDAPGKRSANGSMPNCTPTWSTSCASRRQSSK
ncbi:MAG: hypothetical protein QM736_23620 [Vicinamibacterales bacterium]